MRPISIGLMVSLILNLAFSNQAWSSEVTVREQTTKPRSSEDVSRGCSCPGHFADEFSPCFVNGGFLQNQANKLNDPIRCEGTCPG